MKIKKSIYRIIQSDSEDPNQRQSELILNSLIFISIVGFSLLNIIRIRDIIFGSYNNDLSIFYTLAILVLFIFLLAISKKGHRKTASWLLIIIYSLPMFYSFIVWGADLPAALLLAVLIITLAGILLGSIMVLISTGFITTFLLILTYLQKNNIVFFKDSWRGDSHEIADAIVYAVLMMIIAVIAWLFCRGIGRALERAQQSEKELKQERDSLEIKVAARTEQLRQMEMEKINQLYRLAKFGRLSSGIFHDLINPLTAVSLNLEQIDNRTENYQGNKISVAKAYLSQALLATKKMEKLIAGIKKQIQSEAEETIFSLRQEIEEIIQILSYKAGKANVKITITGETDIKLYGDAVKFGQIITNLIANGIEANENKSDQEKLDGYQLSEVNVNIKTENDMVIIRVRDDGAGITPENLPRIFLPFFSTKKESGRGLGLGLSSAKNIVEKDFNGTISAENLASEKGSGACFTIELPLK